MTPNTATGKTPAELLFKRQPRSSLHRLLPGQSQQTFTGKKESVQGRQQSFEEDDAVWIKNFGQGKKWVAGTVVRRLGSVNYHVVPCGGKSILHRHIDQLIARIPDFGVAQEAIEVGEISRPTEVPDNVRRSQRERKAPAWMEDYRV